MSWPTLKQHDAPADVTLLLEGTYPMVRGGVSAWVDQLIRGLLSYVSRWCSWVGVATITTAFYLNGLPT